MTEILKILPIFICLSVPAVIITFLIWYEIKITGPARIARNEEKKRIFKTAQDHYLKALSYLKINPTDANLKQQALSYGRDFAEITGKYQGIVGVTLFDEVALMNDINAACAGSSAFKSENTIFSPTVKDRLAKLEELRELKLINEQEFDEGRHKILDEI